MIPRNKLMYSYCFKNISKNQCKKCIIYDYTLPKYYLYIPFLIGIIYKHGYLNYYHIYNIISGLHIKYFYLYVLKIREYSSIQFCKLLFNINYCIYSLLNKTSTNEGLYDKNDFEIWFKYQLFLTVREKVGLYQKLSINICIVFHTIDNNNNNKCMHCFITRIKCIS